MHVGHLQFVCVLKMLGNARFPTQLTDFSHTYLAAGVLDDWLNLLRLLANRLWRCQRRPAMTSSAMLRLQELK